MSNQRGGNPYAGRADTNPFNAHTIDLDYDPITVDELVPAVPAHNVVPAPNPYNQGGAWGTQQPAYQQPMQQQQQPAAVPFTASTTSSYVTGSIAKGGRNAPQSAAPPPSLFSSAPAPGPPPPFGGPPNNGGGGASSSQQAAGGAPGGTPQPDPATYPYWNIRRYRTYFDVDTRDVLWRVANSLYGLFKADFMEVTMQSPDLYGPFWVASTLIFVTAVAGNFAGYISWYRDNNTPPPPPPPPPMLPPGRDAPPPWRPFAPTAAPTPEELISKQWFTDYTKMSVSVGMFYGYTFLLSFLLFLLLRYFKSEMQLVNVWCIYGYAMTIFIPVSLGCIAPIEWLRWLLVAAATVVSGLFLVMNFRATIYKNAPAKAVMMLLAIALLHLGMGLALKLYFFHY